MFLLRLRIDVLRFSVKFFGEISGKFCYCRSEFCEI
ncbi:unnamed protein product [Arabidopsis halleri]